MAHLVGCSNCCYCDRCCQKKGYVVAVVFDSMDEKSGPV